MHDNQLGGDADEIERLLNEQKQKQKEASGDAPIEPGPDWTPGVSIHPLELRFEETASCETRDVVVTVFNTDARETLSVLSVTTDLQSFQPKAIANEPDVVEPGGTIAPPRVECVEPTIARTAPGMGRAWTDGPRRGSGLRIRTDLPGYDE